jgi:hypothetical protein
MSSATYETNQPQRKTRRVPTPGAIAAAQALIRLSNNPRVSDHITITDKTLAVAHWDDTGSDEPDSSSDG